MKVFCRRPRIGIVRDAEQRIGRTSRLLLGWNYRDAILPVTPFAIGPMVTNYNTYASPYGVRTVNAYSYTPTPFGWVGAQTGERTSALLFRPVSFGLLESLGKHLSVRSGIREPTCVCRIRMVMLSKNIEHQTSPRSNTRACCVR